MLPATLPLACLLSLLPPPVLTYCAGLGSNPGFTDAPHVEQVSLTSVRVTWQGLVTRGECADQFIVKWWREQYPNDYTFSDLLPLTQFSYVVTDLVPNQNYVFQAVAREDKGLLGKDWNKSPKAYFRTRSNNPTVAPTSWSGEERDVSSRARELREPQTLGVFPLAGMVVGSLLGLLVVVGVVWNIVKAARRSKGGGDSESEGSDSDSLELDLQNTDIESRRGGSRAPSRARSRRRSSPLRSQGSRCRSPVGLGSVISVSGYSSRMGSPSPVPGASAPPSYSD